MVDWVTWNIAGKSLHDFFELDCELDFVFVQEVGAEPEGLAVVDSGDFWVVTGRCHGGFRHSAPQDRFLPSAPSRLAWAGSWVYC